jgi:uncharacterized membrane-anchored protein YjiN (DUF445 family)
MYAPMLQPDPDFAARRSLARHKALAAGLLVLMAGLILLSYALPPGAGTDWLQASAKAGFVGGIADWFAVTALFRHPLGIPIPHTAIIPHEKERLGRALGRFVANHVFTGAEVANVLHRLDLPGMLPRVLASVEDGRARRLAARMIPRVIGGRGAGQVVARALRGIVEGGRHQEVFGFMLEQFKELIASKHDQLQAAIEERVAEQGGRLVGWAIGASVARRVLAMVEAELERMSSDGSELRAAFDEWVRREIARMEEDPQRAAEIGVALRRVLAHETVLAWVWNLWGRLRAALEADAAKPNGRTMAAIEGALANLGALIETDPAARRRVQDTAEGVVRTMLPAAQTRIAEFIAQVVGNWDTRTITEKVELRVGKDLQFVRVNGTLVGFLVGGALYAVLRAIFGEVTF